MMVSVICAYNNKKILDEMLLESLKKQKFKDYEIILINSAEKGFTSASQALNYGAQISNGELLVFTHQDIELIDDSVLERLVYYAKNYDFGVAGVAGVEYGNKIVYSSIYHGEKKEHVGVKISEIKDVYSVDECFFIIKRDNFKSFFELNSWHFYAIEYSLRCKDLNERVVLFPLNIYHLSSGKSLNDNYWHTLKKLSKLYKNMKIIPTPFAQFRNNFLLNFQIIKLKTKLKKVL